MARRGWRIGVFGWAILVSCGKGGGGKSAGPVGPDCAGTLKVLKLSGTVAGKDITREITGIAGHVWDSGLLGDKSEGRFAAWDRAGAMDKPVVEFQFPKRDLFHTDGEGSGQGHVNLGTEGNVGNCMDGGDYPSVIAHDSDANLVRFTLRAFRKEPWCGDGEAQTGEIHGCLIYDAKK